MGLARALLNGRPIGTRRGPRRPRKPWWVDGNFLGFLGISWDFLTFGDFLILKSESIQIWVVPIIFQALDELRKMENLATNTHQFFRATDES